MDRWEMATVWTRNTFGDPEEACTYAEWVSEMGGRVASIVYAPTRPSNADQAFRWHVFASFEEASHLEVMEKGWAQRSGVEDAPSYQRRKNAQPDPRDLQNTIADEMHECDEAAGNPNCTQCNATGVEPCRYCYPDHERASGVAKPMNEADIRLDERKKCQADAAAVAASFHAQGAHIDGWGAAAAANNIYISDKITPFIGPFKPGPGGKPWHHECAMPCADEMRSKTTSDR